MKKLKLPVDIAPEDLHARLLQESQEAIPYDWMHVEYTTIDSGSLAVLFSIPCSECLVFFPYILLDDSVDEKAFPGILAEQLGRFISKNKLKTLSLGKWLDAGDRTYTLSFSDLNALIEAHDCKPFQLKSLTFYMPLGDPEEELIFSNLWKLELENFYYCGCLGQEEERSLDAVVAGLSVVSDDIESRLEFISVNIQEDDAIQELTTLNNFLGLAALLRAHPNLKELDLQATVLSTEGMDEFLEAVTEHRFIKYVGLFASENLQVDAESDSIEIALEALMKEYSETLKELFLPIMWPSPAFLKHNLPRASKLESLCFDIPAQELTSIVIDIKREVLDEDKYFKPNARPASTTYFFEPSAKAQKTEEGRPGPSVLRLPPSP